MTFLKHLGHQIGDAYKKEKKKAKHLGHQIGDALASVEHGTEQNIHKVYEDVRGLAKGAETTVQHLGDNAERTISNASSNLSIPLAIAAAIGGFYMLSRN